VTLTNIRLSQAAAPRILRIVGDDRSGTTVIGTVLGQLPDAIFVGEAGQVWRAFTTPEWRCSCGDLLTSCPFWREVRSQSCVDVNFDVNLLRIITEQYLRVRPGRMASLTRRSLDPLLAEFANALECIYTAIAATAGSGVIIDSGKSAPELLLAVRTLRLNLNILHVVRDPRAVAHSRSRQIPAMQSGSQWMASEGPVTSSMRWAVRNTLLEMIIARYASVHHRMRYEDFVTHPTRELKCLGTFLDTTSIADRLFETGGQIAVGPRHALDGNTRVLKSMSKIQLRLDDEWKSAMPFPKRVSASIPAFPLMLFYGYCTTTC
jgi:hypothetical protein